ncbi:MAG: diaminopimelate aminotransferase [Elusimicrobia bacterium GWA2_69_24]|nr:MAG: diaminopimelate aminotransferase [Elusimicrobia bacterium GWA2_69_24]
MKDQILKRIEAGTDFVLELQKGLTAIPAISPDSGGTGEHDKAVWLEAQLRKLPFDDIKRIDAPDARAKNGVRPSLVARYKGKGSGKTLWIMSHLDIVPPGEMSQWKSDPYVLRVESGKVFGRGVEDNQQAIVSSLLMVKAMMDSGYRPDVDIALLFVADEENGSDYGADYLVEHHPGLFGPRDAFLVPDGGNPDGTMVEVAEKSILWLKIRTEGKQCHASAPERGINAFRAASDLVVRLNALHRKFPKADPLFDPPISTFEPTKKEPNVPNVNTIPGDDVFYLDSRVLPCYPLAKVKAEIRRLAALVEKAYKVTITIDPVQEAQAAPPTPPDSEFVQLVVESIKEVHNVRPKPQGIGGGTVAASLRRLGLHAVVYSKLDDTAHQPNEYCILENLRGDAKVFALTAMKLK